VGGAVLALLAVEATLAPLAIQQSSRSAGVSGSSLHVLGAVPGQFLVGVRTPEHRLAVAAALALACFAGWLLLMRSDEHERGVGLRTLVLAGLGLGAAVATSAAGLEFLTPYRVLEFWMPSAFALAVGFGVHRAAKSGAAATVLLCALSVALGISSAMTPRYQRENWRGVVKALGHTHGGRAIIVMPGGGAVGLGLYLRDADQMPSRGATIKEVAVVGTARDLNDTPPRWRSTPRPPLSMFALVSRHDGGNFTVLRFRGASAVRVNPATLATQIEPFVRQSGRVAPGSARPAEILLETGARRQTPAVADDMSLLQRALDE
jgi:hypothetical protein